MTRIFHAGAETGHIHAEGLTAGSGTTTYATTPVYTGNRSWQFTSSATQVYTTYTHSGAATSTRYWFQIRFRVSALPSSGGPAWLIDVQDAGVSINAVKAALTTGGKIQLLDQAGTQIGSNSSATIAVDTWYTLVLGVEIGVGATDYAELWLDGVSVASTSSGNFMDSAPARWLFGWVAGKAGTSASVYMDDLVLNDDNGSANNTAPDNERVVLLLPTADGTLNNWTGGAGGTSNLYDAINNIPPVGVDTASATNTSQIENATSSANNPVTFTMTDYSTAGVASVDTVTAIYPVIEGANSSVTGADTVEIWIASNPDGSGSKTTASIDSNDGTYPTGWTRTAGTLLETPSVTKGTGPTFTIEKDVATTRVNTVCFAGIYVAYEVGVSSGYAPMDVIWFLSLLLCVLGSLPLEVIMLGIAR